MANRTFSLKLMIIDKKTVKFDQKLTTNSGVKIGHNLTTKRGDSGSAGLPERKCVIIGALNLDTKIDQNSTQQQKMTKNDQNSRNAKSDKIKKSEKVKK